MPERLVALSGSTDKRVHAHRLARAHHQFLSGDAATDRIVRPVIAASWQRCQEAGYRADGPPPPVGDPDEALARWQKHRVSRVFRNVQSMLGELGSGSDQVLLFCDADGTLLWMEGSKRLLHKGQQVHLELGSDWSEPRAGTNAMGTALATRRPTQVFSAEHFALPIHDWSCSATPVIDPDSGDLLGVLAISGPIEVAHPHSLAVVTAAAKILEMQIDSDSQSARLVKKFGDKLNASGGPVGLVTPGGRVAAVSDPRIQHRRLEIADGMTFDLPGAGIVVAEELPDSSGFYIWPTKSHRAETPRHALRLEVLATHPSVIVDGVRVSLQPRQAEVLTLLALRPAGWNADALAGEMLGEVASPVTIRALISRLRPALRGHLQNQPYRLAPGFSADFLEVLEAIAAGDHATAIELTSDDMLPLSYSPAIMEARAHIARSLSAAVIERGDPDSIVKWLSRPMGELDADACEALERICAQSDPRHLFAVARLARIEG